MFLKEDVTSRFFRNSRKLLHLHCVQLLVSGARCLVQGAWCQVPGDTYARARLFPRKKAMPRCRPGFKSSIFAVRSRSYLWRHVRNLPIASNTRDFPDNIRVKTTNRLESLHNLMFTLWGMITIARSPWFAHGFEILNLHHVITAYH